MWKKVLVTGSSGRLGKAAVEALAAAGHFVRGFDRIASDGPSEMIVGDIAHFEAVHSAVAGMDVIIHLAATPDDADFMTSLLPNNILPVHHILESARAHGVSRVILASSGQVNWYRQFTGPCPVRVTDPISPRYWYAVTKVFAEAAGMVFAETHKMDVAVLRLGACPRDRGAAEAIDTDSVIKNVYLSPGDAGRFFLRSVEAKGGFGFQAVFVCSRFATQEIMDLEPAKRLFGYEPKDRWPEGLPNNLL